MEECCSGGVAWGVVDIRHRPRCFIGCRRQANKGTSLDHSRSGATEDEGWTIQLTRVCQTQDGIVGGGGGAAGLA